MKAYIQTKQTGRILNTNIFNAEEGFLTMGIETIHFCNYHELESPGIQREDIIVSGIGVVEHRLKDLGIEVPCLDYPEELRSYLGRSIWKSSINTISSHPELWPVFVKPVANKRFTGAVVREFKDLIGFGSYFDNDEVYCSEVLNILAEWRVFVRYGEIIGVRHYHGDWRAHYDAKVIERAVDTYGKSGNAPAGYGIDFGVTKEGKTVLIEVNDGYSIGCYGLPSLEYAKLLSARWSELTGTTDNCQFLASY